MIIRKYHGTSWLSLTLTGPLYDVVLTPHPKYILLKFVFDGSCKQTAVTWNIY